MFPRPSQNGRGDYRICSTMKFKKYSTVYLAIMLLSALYACKENDPQKFAGTALDPLSDPSKVDPTRYNTEYLLYSSVKINGVLPLESKFADFVKVVGKPDSVKNFNSQTDCQFYEEPYQYIHFQGNLFYLVKDTAIFQNIDFKKRPDLELETPAITLSDKTTLRDVKALFPKAVSKIRTVDSPNIGHLRLVDISASKQYTDGWWILAFDGDILVRVEMFGPC
jgi:hypothetical protein